MSTPYWICVARTATGRFATSRSRRCNLLRPHAHPPAVHISGELIWRCVKGASETAPKEPRAMPTPKKVRLADSFGRVHEKDKKSSTARCRYAGLRSWLCIPSVIPRRSHETPESSSASANSRFSRLFSFSRSFSGLAWSIRRPPYCFFHR